MPITHTRCLLAITALAALAAPTALAQTENPNILIIWGDDVGIDNISAYNLGVMGYRTPNIDRLAREGALFTDVYAEHDLTPDVVPGSMLDP